MGVVALAMAGIAIGQGTGADDTVQEFELTYSTPKVRASTGTDFHAAASSQSNPSGQPAPAREVDLTLAKGTKNNSKAVRRCNADDSDFGEEGADACPS